MADSHFCRNIDYLKAATMDDIKIAEKSRRVISQTVMMISVDKNRAVLKYSLILVARLKYVG